LVGGCFWGLPRLLPRVRHSHVGRLPADELRQGDAARHGGGGPGLTRASRTVVVAGNGMVGHKVVETLLERGAVDEGWEIVVFGEEPRLAYDRVGLSSFFAGTTAEELSLVEAGAYDGVEVHLGDRIESIDRVTRMVTSSKGAVVPYDTLVLATGSY